MHRLSILVLGLTALARAQPAQKVTVDWNRTIAHSHTSLSIQVCPEPPMRRGAPIHDVLYKALRDMKIDYARLQPWFPYPKIGVAELEPPRDGKTFWDFSVMDPIVEDFFAAAEGRPVMLSFSTTPQWMWKTDKPVTYPKDPDEITWDYGAGTELRDPSLKEFVAYYHRLASWYMKGGFEDENGVRRDSGHHFKVAYWEVLNEIEGEHKISPKMYNAIYDAVTADLHQLDPQMKFCGLALEDPARGAEYITTFLDRRNHRPGVPLDMISYHFYSAPSPDESPEIQQHTIFEQADKFLTAVRYIQSIKMRMAPSTRSYINELGSFSGDAKSLDPKLPSSYWTLAGSMWAYLYPQLVALGVDVIGAAELIDYPGQFAPTTLVDWKTGKPNARYWVVKLLRQNFGPGDALVHTEGLDQDGYAQGFVTPRGEHKLLLVNKRNRPLSLNVPGAKGAKISYVDQTTGFEPPATTTVAGDTVDLRPQAVAVLTLTK